MKMILYEKFSIVSDLTVLEAYESLKKEVWPKDYVMPKEKRAKGLGKLVYRDLRLFNGSVDESSFKLVQRFPAFSRGQPAIKGTIEKGENETNIHVVVGDTITSIFFLILSISMLIGCSMMVYQMFTEGKVESLWKWGVFNIFFFPQLFLWTIFMLPFWWEIRVIKKNLYKIFENKDSA